MIENFDFCIQSNIFFGINSLKNISELLKKENLSRVFLISDRGLEQLGIVQKIIDCISSQDVTCNTFLDVEPNPSINTVKKAIESYRQCNADCIIALGGGSPMDLAKAVGLLSKYGGSPYDYVGGGKVPGPVTTMIAIPTTAGTGSEVTAFSVITDTESNYKISIKDSHIIPKYVILDPSLIMTAPASVAASCGIDAFVHASESYISKKANPFTEMLSEKAMFLIGKYIRRFVADRQDKEAASAMMIGSTFAGIAFSIAGLGIIHAMSHPLSAHFSIAHGVANAVLMPYGFDFNQLSDSGKYRIIYNSISRSPVNENEFHPHMLIDALFSLNKELGIPDHFRSVKAPENICEALVKDAMSSGNVFVNPRSISPADIDCIYRKILF